MKAVTIIPGARRLELADIRAPALQYSDEVLIRILEVGLCGTDREIARFEYGSPPEGSEFLVLGHEGLGEVMRTGNAVRGLNPGDLVVPTVRRPCGDPNCPACAVGRQDFCYTGKFKERGIDKLHGFMTEQITERSKYLHRVPSHLRGVAVLVEPLTIACKALRQIFNVQDRLPWGCVPPPQRAGDNPDFSCRTALVLGAGPVGLLAAMALSHAGFKTSVYSRVSGSPERAEISRAIGSEFIAAEEIPMSGVSELLGKVDVILEAVGASQLAFDALDLLGPNAVFIFTGVPGRKTGTYVNTDRIMRNVVLKNQAIIGTVNAAPEDFDTALRMLSDFENRWPGVPARLKTQRLDPGQVPEALKSKQGIKEFVSF